MAQRRVAFFLMLGVVGGSVSDKYIVGGEQFVAVVLVWLLFWTSVVAAARTVSGTPRFRRGMSRMAGAVLVALGVRTATAR
ncbi:hypothetical protein [Streptomyces coffeae]|uniref:hypothetical protein n=1 Tax=Streptomyces coffeae TaxID=621382 RepID=UPI001F368C20|nr:hypothetical protein [Streptomyces coffeae]